MGQKVMARNPGSINEGDGSSTLGLAQKKVWEKDEDGEYENTKGLEN